jgi:hypothetical protein
MRIERTDSFPTFLNVVLAECDVENSQRVLDVPAVRNHVTRKASQVVTLHHVLLHERFAIGGHVFSDSVDKHVIDKFSHHFVLISIIKSLLLHN